MTNNPKLKIKLDELKDILDAQVLFGNDFLSIKIETVFASDMMSNVLAFAKEDSLLLTGLINQQVVRTAEMAGIAAICFVRGKTPPEKTIMLAKEKNIPLLATELSMYKACGILHKEGLQGYDEVK
jgi:predicted transcriptional regulator